MSTYGVSNVFLTQQTLRLIGVGQQNLSTLQEQLSTGLKTSDLSKLGLTDSRRLLDLRGQASSRESYTEVINILQPRVTTQNAIMDNMQGLISQIQTAINTSQTSTGAIQNASDSNAPAAAIPSARRDDNFRD